MSSAFLSLRSLTLATEPVVLDRLAELGVVCIYPVEGDTGASQIQVSDLAVARAHLAAWTRTVELLEQAQARRDADSGGEQS